MKTKKNLKQPKAKVIVKNFFLKQIFHDIKIYIFRGLLAVIPLALSFLAVRFFYEVIDRQVVGWFGFNIPGLGILIVLVFLCALGVIASNVIGKKIFELIEEITKRIPVIKAIYQVGKQLSLTLSLPGGRAFKKVVLVEFFQPGCWTVGFVTGTLIDRTERGENFLKVFIPQTPNPTSGWIIVVRESQTRDPGWSVEDAMKVVISGGILGAEEIRIPDGE